MHFVKQKFLELDGPTWVVAIVLYGAWILLVKDMEYLPGGIFWRPCSVPFIPFCRTRIAK